MTGKQSLEQKVLAFIREEEMIAPGSMGIVAVSGGADSICLLHVLSGLAETLETGFSVCHVMHGIRGEEAKRDAEYVRRSAEQLGISCRIYERDVPALAKAEGLSLEEAGRKARYECLQEYKEEQGADWIALAHQEEDQAETILFHILRGTGLRGLRGILPVQEDRIRPLLRTGRAEIEAWLKEHGIDFCTDSTNLESDYSRNRIRNIVLPELCRINEGAGEHLLSLAREAEELYDIQEAYVEELRRNCRFLNNAGEWVSFEMSDGEAATVKRILLPDSIVAASETRGRIFLGELILQELERLSGKRKDLTRRHISMVQQLFGRETGKRADLPYGLAAVRTYEGVELRRDEDLNRDGYPEPAAGNREEAKLSVIKRPYQPGESIPDGTEMILMDADAVHGSPVLRTPRQGDTIVLFEDGRKKTLARFFTDRKIPEDRRNSYPVLADDDSILWVVGLRLSEHVKVKPETKEVYEVRIDR